MEDQKYMSWLTELSVQVAGHTCQLQLCLHNGLKYILAKGKGPERIVEDKNNEVLVSI